MRLVSTFQLSKLWCFGVLAFRPPVLSAVRAKVEIQFGRVKIMSEREVIGVEALVDKIMDTMDDVCIHDRC
jgi:hypothetical protein